MDSGRKKTITEEGSVLRCLEINKLATTTLNNRSFEGFKRDKLLVLAMGMCVILTRMWCDRIDKGWIQQQKDVNWGWFDEARNTIAHDFSIEQEIKIWQAVKHHFPNIGSMLLRRQKLLETSPGADHLRIPIKRPAPKGYRVFTNKGRLNERERIHLALDTIKIVLAAVKGVSLGDLEKNELLVLAMAMSIVYTKSLCGDIDQKWINQQKDVNWGRFEAIRNLLTHEYHIYTRADILNAVNNRLPEVERMLIRRLKLPEMSQGVDEGKDPTSERTMPKPGRNQHKGSRKDRSQGRTMERRAVDEGDEPF